MYAYKVSNEDRGRAAALREALKSGRVQIPTHQIRAKIIELNRIVHSTGIVSIDDPTNLEKIPPKLMYCATHMTWDTNGCSKCTQSANKNSPRYCDACMLYISGKYCYMCESFLDD